MYEGLSVRLPFIYICSGMMRDLGNEVVGRRSRARSREVTRKCLAKEKKEKISWKVSLTEVRYG